LTENAGMENVARSSGAYSGFQVRWPEVRKSGDGSPPVESRGNTPVGSLKTAPRSSSLFVYESINFTSAIAQKTMSRWYCYSSDVRPFLCLYVRHSVHLSVTLWYCMIVSKRTKLGSWFLHWRRARGLSPCPEKNGPPKHIKITSSNASDFRNSFTVTISWKFAIKQSLNIPPHLKRVATLPCEILMSEN